MFNFMYFCYRDVHSWHNSLVVKRVLFECADCFLPLFYIAFYQFDVEALRNELIGLFYSKYVIYVLKLFKQSYHNNKNNSYFCYVY